jgi:4-hydroxy-tetrahydrodipicolinate synthase
MDFQTTLPDGVITAVMTPLREDLSIDHDALAAHCKWILANDGDGIVVLGTTGEANSFTVEERLETIDRIVRSGLPVDRLMIGTGCCAFPDTIRLTKFAVERGVGGILMLPPFYYKQVSDAGLAKYFDLVVRGVNDERLKIYLYNFPKLSGIGFSATLTRHLVREYPGVVVGMKDSSGDWDHMAEIIREIPGFKLYAGTEKLLLRILREGGAGCISATTNATVAMAARLFRNWQSDEADALQEQLTAVRNAFDGHPFTSALKQMFYEWTNDPAWLNMRPPNSPLDAAEWKELSGRLRSLGFTIPAN